MTIYCVQTYVKITHFVNLFKMTIFFKKMPLKDFLLTLEEKKRYDWDFLMILVDTQTQVKLP